MRIAIIFSITVLMLSFIIPESMDNKSAATYIYLGSGFTNDTVSLGIETFQVLTSEVVSSNQDHNDLTDIYIKMTNDSIFCYKSSTLLLKQTMKGDGKSIKILITINNHPYSYTMHLKQGRYVFISKHASLYNVYFNQFKRPVSLY